MNPTYPSGSYYHQPTQRQFCLTPRPYLPDWFGIKSQTAFYLKTLWYVSVKDRTCFQHNQNTSITPKKNYFLISPSKQSVYKFACWSHFFLLTVNLLESVSREGPQSHTHAFNQKNRTVCAFRRDMWTVNLKDTQSSLAKSLHLGVRLGVRSRLCHLLAG